MESFLYKIAEKIYKTCKEDLSGLCIVFPGRRAGLYFSHYLAEITNKPIWSPEIYTINEFIQKLSDLQPADNLSLIFDLYRIYLKEKRSSETFDEFYFWGEMLLNDFDEIDKYMVNAKDLFQNLAALKNIEKQFSYLSEEQIEALKSFWKSFDPPKYTRHQESFMQTWNVLYNIYKEFNEYLSSQGIAYEGKIYRQVAEDIKTDNINIPWEKIIFIGFNALNKCEEILFDYLQINNKAEFYWDYDNYYIEDTNHEAGLFLRKNLRKYPSPETDTGFNSFSSLPKEIEFIAVPSNLSQSGIVNRILEKSSAVGSFDFNKVVVVLPDEHMLIPVLYSIPASIEAINVTMGYPLKDTPVFSLVCNIIELQKNCRHSSDDEIMFYYDDIMAVLNHQHINKNNTEGSSEIINFINKYNKIYVTAGELQTNDLFRKIFRKIEKSGMIPDYLLDILHHICLAVNGEENKKIAGNIEQDTIYNLYTAIKRLDEILSRQTIKPEQDTLLKIIKKITGNIRVPFTGEPLTGMQVMGVLETRAIDFENVIILSMNEGVFPTVNISSSFIPYNLRKGFGIPTIEHQEAIYSYYFYRLLQRAKNIHLVYSTDTGDMRTGEMSRFMYQLKYESDLNIMEKNLVYDVSLTLPAEIKISKSSDLTEILFSYIDDNNYLSPSAINTYMDCSLKFYFRYLAGISEPKEVSGEIDAACFGSLLHKTINILYKPYTGSTIQTEDLQNMQKNKEKTDAAILNAFKNEFFLVAENIKVEIEGRNILVYEVLKKYISEILETDKRFTPLEIICLEKHFKIRFPIAIKGKQYEVNLGGTIDRIDKCNDLTRIIDYKTGSGEKSFKGISSLFVSDKNRNSGVFQTLLYSMLYKKNSVHTGKITPGLYYMREIVDENFDYFLKETIKRGKSVPVEDYDQYAGEFENELRNLLNEMFNPDSEFKQTENEDICRYCPYKMICYKD